MCALGDHHGKGVRRVLLVEVKAMSPFLSIEWINARIHGETES